MAVDCRHWNNCGIPNGGCCALQLFGGKPSEGSCLKLCRQRDTKAKAKEAVQMGCSSCQRKKAQQKDKQLPDSKPPLAPQEAFKGFRCVLVNLKKRADRLANFTALKLQTGWSLPEPQVFEALSGDALGVPSNWRSGGGAYGLIRSYIQILERAIMDNAPGVIFLEDDVDWDSTMNEDLAAFLGNVPSDWEALWLGGHGTGGPYDLEKQKRMPIAAKNELVAPGVLRVYAFERTHAFVVKGQKVMKDLLALWNKTNVHCDWVLGNFQATHKVYAAEYPLFCQARSKSDISGSTNRRNCWRPTKGDLPVVLLKASKEVARGLEAYGFHRGYDRDYANTDIDNGLKNVFADKKTDKQKLDGLRAWVADLQYEVSQTEGLITTVWHPDATADMLREVTKGEVISIEAETVEQALEAYPMEKLRDYQSRPRGVVLLKAERDVAEQLRGIGFHMGNWRDAATGMDNGLIQAMKAKPSDRAAKVREIYETWLKPEAASIANGVVCFWHPEATRELIAEATKESVIEIEADSFAHAFLQWQKVTKGVAE